MHLPTELITSLQGLPGFNERDFKDTHDRQTPITSIRVNPLKPVLAALTANEALRLTGIPWTDFGYYLDKRPSFTFDPLFHAGCYYVQEASSMFLEQAVKASVDLTKSLKVLDLCAAPGGKSTHLQSLIPAAGVLVSNEVIKSRAAVLKENIIKWGGGNVAVTNNDPRDFAALPGFFDLVVVDAPCSGSGLFRRDPEAINEWSEKNVTLCSQRQQRILADILPALKEEGVLIYATCSYSEMENERILSWLVNELGLESLQIDFKEAWGITETFKDGAFGYRFWPGKVKGEGFFIAACRKKTVPESGGKYRQKNQPIVKKQKELLAKWLVADEKEFVQFGDTIYAWGEHHFKSFDLLAQKLKVIYSGVAIGELMKEKLVPNHALATSTIGCKIPVWTLSGENAVKFLQRKELNGILPEPGWKLVVYQGHPIGWANVLHNRVNNYYPRELRILNEQK